MLKKSIKTRGRKDTNRYNVTSNFYNSLWYGGIPIKGISIKKIVETVTAIGAAVLEGIQVVGVSEIVVESGILAAEML